MRSSDLARLADVSVRTLRHYHQIGLLPEPGRSANGYRLYTVADLVRVLRIRRLADLGMPLARMDPDVDVDEELALLDREYARQIDELRQRRAAITALRRDGARADTPAFAEAYLATLGARGDIAADLVEAERDAAVLLEVLLDTGSTGGRHLFADADVERFADVSAAFLSLEVEASEQCVQEAADALASALASIPRPRAGRSLGAEAARTLESHVDEQLTPVQRRALRLALRQGPA